MERRGPGRLFPPVIDDQPLARWRANEAVMARSLVAAIPGQDRAAIGPRPDRRRRGGIVDRIARSVPRAVAVGQVIDAVALVHVRAFGELWRLLHRHLTREVDHVGREIPYAQRRARAAACVEIGLAAAGIHEHHRIDRLEAVTVMHQLAGDKRSAAVAIGSLRAIGDGDADTAWGRVLRANRKVQVPFAAAGRDAGRPQEMLGRAIVADPGDLVAPDELAAAAPGLEVRRREGTEAVRRPAAARPAGREDPHLAVDEQRLRIGSLERGVAGERPAGGCQQHGRANGCEPTSHPVGCP